MITGTVNADREPMIRVAFYDTNGIEYQCDALVDTGYGGWLTLPPDYIATLGLSWKELGEAVLADGSEIFFDVYDAKMMWDGQEIAISIDESDSKPLVGMALMDGYRITVEDVVGGQVILERMIISPLASP